MSSALFQRHKLKEKGFRLNKKHTKLQFTKGQLPLTRGSSLVLLQERGNTPQGPFFPTSLHAHRLQSG